ncbi:MAG: hypothetical protein R2764_02665 [Bacteroidales bacterium]
MKKIPFRLEEVPVVASMVMDSLNRDLADFTAFSPKYDAVFVSDIATKVKAVEVKTNTQVYIAQLKTITTSLYNSTDSLRPLMTRLEGYVMLAKDELNIAPADFGISDVRNKIGTKDVEGLLDKLAITLMHTTNNLAVLETKGFTAEALTELETLTEAIRSKNPEQNLKMDEKEAGVQANLGLIKELWEIIAEVMDIGKRLYKYDDTEKTGDYTISTIKSRIRHEGSAPEPDDPQP